MHLREFDDSDCEENSADSELLLLAGTVLVSKPDVSYGAPLLSGFTHPTRAVALPFSSPLVTLFGTDSEHRKEPKEVLGQGTDLETLSANTAANN